jgi:hypothetical protein
MSTPRFRSAAALAAGLVLAALSCTQAPVDPAVAGAAAVPDFGLTDVNRASPTFQNRLSPRMYVGQVSAWYFGHST